MYKELFEQLKKRVRYDMNWSDKDENGVRRFPDKPEKETVFREEVALAILLLSDTIFVNDHWWMGDKEHMQDKPLWPKEACDMTSLNVNLNDVLMWGCADACEMKYDEIQEVYEYWEKDPHWGTAIWYCKKVNMMPQKPVAESIRKMGIWDIDNMNLKKNPTD